jgi:hypothetical protein
MSSSSSFPASLSALPSAYSLHLSVSSLLSQMVGDVSSAASLTAARAQLGREARAVRALDAAREQAEEEALRAGEQERATGELLGLLVASAVREPEKQEKQTGEQPEKEGGDVWMELLREKEEEVERLRQELSALQGAAGPPPPQAAEAPPEAAEAPPPGFPELEDAILFQVFGFLDASDVLSAAVADRKFFSRVDQMFGIGSSINSPAKAKRKAPSADPSPGPAPAPAKSAPGSLLSRGFTTLTAAASQRFASSSSSSPAAAAAAAAAPAAAAPPPPPSAEPPAQDVSVFATSIADKLTAAELKSIIALTDRLKAKDRDLQRAEAEREDLAARLEGAESVKEFLVGKLKALEGENEALQTAAALREQQVKSDAEVIGFVDAKAKDLERGLGEALGRAGKAEEALGRVVGEKGRQMKVLEDMLQFEVSGRRSAERARAKEGRSPSGALTLANMQRVSFKNAEASHKTTKKALVREVKSARAALEKAAAERDALRAENLGLKARESMSPDVRRSSIGLSGI